MTIQNILLSFHSGSTSPLVCLLVVLLAAGLAYCLVRGYVYLMRKYGRLMAAFLLSVALFSAVVADKPDAGSTNAPPDGVSGTNTVEQTGADGTNQMENGEWIMDNAGGFTGILHSPLSILHLDVEPLAVRPANAVENARWRARGAHIDGVTIPAEGWSFRTPAGFLDSLLVYSYGEIQPDVETTYFPRPFPEADLSLLPEGKWGRLPHEGAESLFWHAASPSNSLILTWQNAAYDRDANCPTNLQIELFSNGTCQV